MKCHKELDKDYVFYPAHQETSGNLFERKDFR